MAGEVLQKIFCWHLRMEDLNIFLTSTSKGGHRIWLSLEECEDPLDFFMEKMPKNKCIMDEVANSALAEAVRSRLDNLYLESLPPFDFFFSPFESRVYNAISQIPFGETRQYGEVASIVGIPGGARAVGQAMKRNPFPIIFPCHRVVAANGLGGFSSGLEIKRYLLGRESKRVHGDAQ